MEGTPLGINKTTDPTYFFYPPAIDAGATALTVTPSAMVRATATEQPSESIPRSNYAIFHDVRPTFFDANGMDRIISP